MSAEVYGAFNKKQVFKPRVIPKKPEQRERLVKKLSQVFMFQALDDKEREIVLSAMEEKKFKYWHGFAPEPFVLSIQTVSRGHD